MKLSGARKPASFHFLMACAIDLKRSAVQPWRDNRREVLSAKCRHVSGWIAQLNHMKPYAHDAFTKGRR